ncbi:MAG: 6-phospho-3-hexuloisomerase [candidate division WS1 bacterium]|jgi:6-phospho-3-hexuloisomerase|nr:6-phospho-3-hexuloisomerase [candidate division WS1 bacterium]
MSDSNNRHLLIAREISGVLSGVDPQRVEALGETILTAQRIFVCGAGRSLLMLKALAMRLMHLGLHSYVVGETITPAIRTGDLLIAGSGSGETRTTLAMVQAAHERGARTAAITAHPQSPIARACDLVVEIPAAIVGVSNQRVSTQPPGSLFEQCLLVLGDGLVLWLMERLGATYEEIRARHTKLE